MISSRSPPMGFRSQASGDNGGARRTQRRTCPRQWVFRAYGGELALEPVNGDWCDKAGLMVFFVRLRTMTFRPAEQGEDLLKHGKTGVMIV
jgi:hypothetical protein